MKPTKNLFILAVVGALTLAANKAAAFPLYLTSLGGSISTTAYYGSDNFTTSNKSMTVAMSLSKIVTLVSNNVFLDTGFHPPANAKIAFDPYTLELFMTNSGGYYRSLTKNGNNEGRVRIRNIATTFTTNGLTESDKINIELDLYGIAADGRRFEFQVRGTGTLSFSKNSTSGIAAMSIKLGNSTGSGYGELKGSGEDGDGVSLGGFSFSGTGTPEWSTAYSIYWRENLN
jgi:uncharacterized membrane protein YgcG